MNIQKLAELNRLANKLLHKARVSADEQVWEDTYKLIFSDQISKTVFALVKEINFSTDYYDPDTTYREDVEAFMEFFNGIIHRMTVLGLVTVEQLNFNETSEVG